MLVGVGESWTNRKLLPKPYQASMASSRAFGEKAGLQGVAVDLPNDTNIAIENLEAPRMIAALVKEPTPSLPVHGHPGSAVIRKAHLRWNVERPFQTLEREPRGRPRLDGEARDVDDAARNAAATRRVAVDTVPVEVACHSREDFERQALQRS